MFEPCDSARIFAIALGKPFAEAFAHGLLTRTAHLPPEALARVLIFANSGRMRSAIHAALTRGGARLLPRIHVVTDLPDLPVMPETLPPPIPKLRRQLLLARAVGALLEAEHDFAPQSAKFALAGSLAVLMDEMQAEGVPPDAVRQIDVAHHSGHWQRSLRFLSIIADHWDNTDGADDKERLRRAAEAMAQHWQGQPPDHPVIVAGSTGSQGATALLMSAVGQLPQGAVVLPGWDAAQPPEVWEAMRQAGVSADHPQSMLLAHCTRSGVDPARIADWSATRHDTSERSELLSLALRPAPFTDQWLDEGPDLVTGLSAATENLGLIEAASPKEEAAAIALALRKAAETDASAVLITHDRTLARRVEAMLGRWGITPDDSAGRPLHQTPPGVFLRLVAACIGHDIPPDVFVALLKHPLTGSGAEDTAFKLITADFELQVLRGGGPSVDFDALQTWARDPDHGTAARRLWADWVWEALHPLTEAQSGDAAVFLSLHRMAAERLVSGPDDGTADKLWSQEDGAALATLFSDLQAEADVADTPTATEYKVLFDTLLAARNVTETRPSHPRIAIWGTLEARVAQADLVVLGGLNEGIWPASEPPDPWLNRAMRMQIGLPTFDRVIGLSAHDFQQAVSADHVILSRALRDGEAPTVGSRWIVRLLNLLGGLGDEGEAALKEMRRRGMDWVHLARGLDRATPGLKAEHRPAPMPPVSARFTELSVTEVEHLIRDPYAIYARRTLGLRKLDPLGQTADALLRGNVLHSVMERFNETYPDTLPENADAALLEVADAVMAKTVPWPSIRAMWRARLARVAPMLAASERQRRSKGRVLAQEVRGERNLTDPAVRLYGRADRIDALHDNRLALFDYKAGAPPTPNEQKYFRKQLALEAAIAVEGGFRDVPAAEVAWLEYIGLSGQGLSEAASSQGTVYSAAEAAEIWSEFASLVAEYHTPGKGFPSRVRVRNLSYDLDFDHLARHGEWWDTDDPVERVVP